MKKTMTTMKLVWLTMMALPMMAVADLVTPAWDETVREPVVLFHAWDWRCWSVFAVAFAIVICLTIWWGRRRSKKCPSTGEYVVLEVCVGVAIAACIYLFGGMSFGNRERVIHHPESRPDHYPPYDYNEFVPHTEASPGDARW